MVGISHPNVCNQSMMNPKRERQIRHIPRGVRIISTLYILGGLLTLLISSFFFLTAYILFATIDETGGGGPGIGRLLYVVMFVGAGAIGTLLSLLIIAAGVGLKKVRESSLTIAYIPISLWILFGLQVILMSVPTVFSLTGFIGALIIGVSLTNGIYLECAIILKIRCRV
jgi:hypothetical protein